MRTAAFASLYSMRKLMGGGFLPGQAPLGNTSAILGDHAIGIELGWGACAIELAQLVICQRDLCGAQVVLKLFGCARAEDDAGYYWLCAEPGERDL